MFKRLQSWLFSAESTMEHRMFVFGSIAVHLGLLSAFIISIVAGLGIVLTIISALFLVLCVATFFYVQKTRNYQLGNLVYLVLAVYITFPIGIVVGGGIFSGVPVWFIIAVVYIAMVFKGRMFFITITLSLVIF